MANAASTNKNYDFTGKDPKVALTPDELKYFKEGMRLKNESLAADSVDFEKAVQSVNSDLDRLFS